MSSAFDSEVYSERQRLPGVSINLQKLLRELMWANTDDGHKVMLSLEYRPNVATGQWWELRWGDQFVGATELELCLFRAAVLRRRDDERAKKYAGIDDPPATITPEGPTS